MWKRNNHNGGFVRFAFAPTAKSGDHKAFDDGAYVFTCWQRGGCRGQNGVTGGDANADCKLDFNIPTWLSGMSWDTWLPTNGQMVTGQCSGFGSVVRATLGMLCRVV